jgi:hypothetical protein
MFLVVWQCESQAPRQFIPKIFIPSLSGDTDYRPHRSRPLELCTEGVSCLQATRDVSGICVTEDGQPCSKLLGVVTSRDTDFINDRLTPLSEVMTR